LVDEGKVGVLQRGSADLDVGDGLAVLLEQVEDELGGLVGRLHVSLPVAGPAHLVLADDLPGELLRCPVGDDPPAVEDQDAVGELLGLVQVVGGEQDRGLALLGEAVDEVVEVSPGSRVEPGGGLVQEQQLGLFTARCW
jgi:hypothetical protein